MCVGTTAALLHHRIVSSTEQQARVQGATALARAVTTTMLEDNIPDVKDFDLLCERILANSSSLLAVRIWDATGRRLGERAMHQDFLGCLESKVPSGAISGIAALRGMNAEQRVPANVLRVDLDVGGQPGVRGPYHLALTLARPGVLWTSAFWSFVGWYGGACILIGVAGWLAMRRSVITPLELLTGIRPDIEPQPAAALLAERNDDWGSLARALGALRREMVACRDSANRAERRLESQIASQTREIVRDLRRFQREAWVDPLTGVKNRRLLEEKLPEMFSAQRSAGQDLSVVMLDLDHFKKLNDAHGHQAGDRILKFAGELLRQCLRGHDVPVRYGGDEFVLILPGIGAKEAMALTRRISTMFAQRVKMMMNMDPSPTMTAGIASLENNKPRSPAGLLACADHALYQAKKSGRGRARICQPDYQLSVE